MNWIQRLFGWKKKKPQESYMQSEELLKLRELDSFMRALLKGDHYVARSESILISLSYSLLFLEQHGSFGGPYGTYRASKCGVLSRHSEKGD